MAQPVTAAPSVTSSDRLGMTIFFALLFHGILILGISFVSSPSAEQKIPPSLDVILLNSSNQQAPEKADYLAQVSQDGGGNSEQKLRRTDVFSAPTLSEQAGIAQQQPSTARPQQPKNAQQAFVTADRADQQIKTDKRVSREELEKDSSKPQQQNELSARIAQELSMTLQEHAQKPREKYLTSRTKEYVAAGYMRNWIDKVERLGNADYPDTAIRNKLSGTLILDVVIRADGSLQEINLRRSSGHQILDDAAKRIVRMASPFAAFPPGLQKQADVIHITRSWEFKSSNQLTSY